MTFYYPTKEALKKQIEYNWSTATDYYIGFSSSPVLWTTGSDSSIHVVDSQLTELVEVDENIRGNLSGTDIEYIYSESTASFDVISKPITLQNTTTSDIDYSNMFVAFGTMVSYVAELKETSVLPANDGNVSKAPEIVRFGPTSDLQTGRNLDFWCTNASYSIGLFSNPSLIVDEYEGNKVLRIEDNETFLESEVTSTLEGINGRGYFVSSGIGVEQKIFQTVIDLGSTEITVGSSNNTYNFVGLFQEDLIIYGAFTEEPREFKTEKFDVEIIEDWQQDILVI